MRVDTLDPRGGQMQPSGLSTAQAGQLVYANGTTFNPGQGAGWYMWTGTEFTPYTRQFIFDSGYLTAAANVFPTIPAVTGTVHGGYFFEIQIQAALGSLFVAWTINGDTTTADYDSQILTVSGSVATATSAANNTIFNATAAGDFLYLSGDISISGTGIVTLRGQGFQKSNGALGGITRAAEKIAAVTDITSIQFPQTAVGLTIGAGSRIRLWSKF